eukprot:7233508-Alexandrium_andersonii.AAC.1
MGTTGVWPSAANRWRLSIGVVRHPTPSSGRLPGLLVWVGAWAQRALAAPSGEAGRPPSAQLDALRNGSSRTWTDGRPEAVTRQAVAPRRTRRTVRGCSPPPWQ